MVSCYTLIRYGYWWTQRCWRWPLSTGEALPSASETPRLRRTKWIDLDGVAEHLCCCLWIIRIWIMCKYYVFLGLLITCFWGEKLALTSFFLSLFPSGFVGQECQICNKKGIKPPKKEKKKCLAQVNFFAGGIFFTHSISYKRGLESIPIWGTNFSSNFFR